MVAHTCHVSTWEAETGEPQVPGQSRLHTKILSQKKKSNNNNNKIKLSGSLISNIYIIYMKRMCHDLFNCSSTLGIQDFS
jgi:hypothetical protein